MYTDILYCFAIFIYKFVTKKFITSEILNDYYKLPVAILDLSP